MKGLGDAAGRRSAQAKVPAWAAERRQSWIDRHGGPGVMTIERGSH